MNCKVLGKQRASIFLKDSYLEGDCPASWSPPPIEYPGLMKGPHTSSGRLAWIWSSSSLQSGEEGQSEGSGEIGEVGEGWESATHWVPAFFSEKKRSRKSPSLLGSKVEGTTIYSPGGRRMRLLTSRRLIKCSDCAREALARKKSRFKCTG